MLVNGEKIKMINFKKKLNKRNLLCLFVLITMFLILENPTISQINIYYSYVTLNQNQPQTQDGLFYQGSSIINQNTLTYVNQTTYQPIAYKSTISILNFGSLMLLFTPIIINIYLNDKKEIKKNNKVKKEE
jgi:type IV secretory pathway VirB3-like protein